MSTGLTVFTAYEVSQYHKKQVRAILHRFRKALKKLVEERTRGMICVPCCSATMERAMFDAS